MKKIVIYIAVLSFMVTAFAGCKSNEVDTNKQNTTEDITLSDLVEIPSTELTVVESSEILTPATEGILLPIDDVKLGDNVLKAYENADPAFENNNTDKPYAQFDTVRYYYETTENENGVEISRVYRIVEYKEGYGFTCGLTTTKDVLNSLGSQEPKLEAEEDLYFLLSKGDNTYSLTYKAGENTLKFFFSDDYLVAVTLQSHD